MGKAVYFGRVYCRLSLYPWCPSFIAQIYTFYSQKRRLSTLTERISPYKMEAVFLQEVIMGLHITTTHTSLEIVWVSFG